MAKKTILKQREEETHNIAETGMGGLPRRGEVRKKAETVRKPEIKSDIEEAHLRTNKRT